ncbi:MULTISPECIES: DEAD/DEAH box helicase [unclassified Oceanobacillus]|uniref:SNF2-related protein n=1 Tax=unclassified Oceanobacillus TaxID=2630292 RepID=UPI001BE5B048|nr:DEAD/DEAH box helicase [Oceanobacillus sp. ISL-74]MBT2652021.1 DEAD/DEAH box helicase [Oceanobacillus sp. ISL-73]
MKFKPHNYQLYNINRVLSDPFIALWLDMGLGKTVITLTAINDLKYNRFAVNKVLIIAPKKVAQGTWTNEAKKWDHLNLLRFSIVLGSQTKRIRALNTPADVYIINRENIPWLVDYYRNSWPFDMVVIDESSSFKNLQSKRFKALKGIRPHIKRQVQLTGTPSPNGLIDIWSQIFLLDGGQRLGKTIDGFRERYFEPDQRNRDRIFSYAPKDGADNKIHSLIGDIVVSMKASDYIELPAVTYNSVPVILDDKAKKAYEKLEKEMLLEVDEAEITATSAAVLGGKLLQLCNGAVYDENRNIIDIHNNKMESFLELIEALNGSPALVFYNFQHDKARIIEALKKQKLRVRELKTAEDELDWNNKEIDVLLAHPASAGYGLNLQQGGNHIIWFGLNWNLELYQQANARLARQGQKEKVFIHRLTVMGGMDQNVEEALIGKAATQESLLSALKARIEKVKEEGA